MQNAVGKVVRASRRQARNGGQEKLVRSGARRGKPCQGRDKNMQEFKHVRGGRGYPMRGRVADIFEPTEGVRQPINLPHETLSYAHCGGSSGRTLVLARSPYLWRIHNRRTTSSRSQPTATRYSVCAEIEACTRGCEKFAHT